MVSRRTHEAELSLVQQQQTQIAGLQDQVDFLQNRQTTGPSAAAIEILLKSVDTWVADGSPRAVNPDGPQKGLYPSLDSALNAGISDAVRTSASSAMANLPADRQIEIARTNLDPETFRRVLYAGLATLVRSKPGEVVEALPDEVRTELINEVVTDPELKEQLLERLHSQAVEEPHIIDQLQAEYDAYGFFSTDKLPVGARVTIDGIWRKYGVDKSFTQHGVVVTTESSSQYIRPVGSRQIPLITNDFILGSTQGGTEDFKPQVMPGTRVDVAEYSKKLLNGFHRVVVPTNDGCISEITKFEINGKSLTLQQYDM